MEEHEQILEEASTFALNGAPAEGFVYLRYTRTLVIDIVTGIMFETTAVNETKEQDYCSFIKMTGEKEEISEEELKLLPFVMVHGNYSGLKITTAFTR
jgi:hypothetical protein